MITEEQYKDLLKQGDKEYERDEIIEGDKQRDEQKDWINKECNSNNLPACPGHIGDKRAFEEGAKAELNHIIQILCGNKIESELGFKERLQKTLTNAYIEIINGIINFSYSNNDIKTLTEILDELKRIRTKFEITR
jgi:hypothetical protein